MHSFKKLIGAVGIIQHVIKYPLPLHCRWVRILNSSQRKGNTRDYMLVKFKPFETAL